MTPMQRKRLYFPAWQSAWKRNWVMDGATVVAVGEPDVSVRAILDQMEVIALQRARAAGRGMTADDLRHAGHVVALGRPVSSNDLDNRDLDRVMSLWRLLADPEDLSAVMAWEKPATAERRRMEWFVQNSGLPREYVLEICQKRFHCGDPLKLDDAPLHQLVVTLKMRLRSWKEREAQAH